MRIAVDVMGGDHGPAVVINGVSLALKGYPAITQLYMVGDEAAVREGLAFSNCSDPRVSVVHASQVLSMDDKPMDVLRRKRDCSMVKAIELVKSKQADAVVSPGNTGGLFAASTVLLRPIEGVKRAAIATVIPTPHSEFVLIDSGANVECRPLHLVQFGVMGSIYARNILGHKNPRVGILSNGTEDSKGTELTQQAARLCKKTGLNFVGYVEGHDLFEDHVDVVVCDGFVGNIVLKTIESFAKGLVGWLKDELKQNPKRMLGAYLAKGALAQIKSRMDPDAYGGAPLLGLNGSVLKAHGSAREKSIMNAVRVACETLESKVNNVMAAEIATVNAMLPDDALIEPAA